MAIKELPNGGGTLITGREDTELFALLAMRSALKLEIQTGLKMNRGRSISAVLKDRFGFTGTKVQRYEKLDAMIEAIGKERRETSASGGERKVH